MLFTTQSRAISSPRAPLSVWLTLCGSFHSLWLAIWYVCRQWMPWSTRACIHLSASSCGSVADSLVQTDADGRRRRGNDRTTLSHTKTSARSRLTQKRAAMYIHIFFRIFHQQPTAYYYLITRKKTSAGFVFFLLSSLPPPWSNRCWLSLSVCLTVWRSSGCCGGMIREGMNNQRSLLLCWRRETGLECLALRLPTFSSAHKKNNKHNYVRVHVLKEYLPINVFCNNNSSNNKVLKKAGKFPQAIFTVE